MDVCQPGFRSASARQTAFHGFEFEDVDDDVDADVIAADYAHGGDLLLFGGISGNR